MLWTRVTPSLAAVPGSGLGEPVTVRWTVATDPGFLRNVRSGTYVATADRDHTVKIDVAGLEPSTTYYFRFAFGAERSPIGRTRTAPAPSDSPERLRFGVVSCANWQAGFFSSYRHLAEADLDAIIHLGDYIYEYGPGIYSYGNGQRDVRLHDPAHEALSLSDYRRRHAQYKTDPDLAALHATVPFIATWDDHEVADGWWPGGAFEHQRDEGSFQARKEAALRAYDEWMPVRLSGTARSGDGQQIYRSFRYGDLADLAMLDLRGYRDPRVTSGDQALQDPARSIAGEPQHRWLVDHLRTPRARWRLVGSPVMMAPVLMPPRPQGQELALRRTTDPTTWGTFTPNTDVWSGYPVERRQLLESIAGVDNVVFLAGDVHTAWANEIQLDGRSVATELVCSSLTSNNIDDFMGTAPRSVSIAMEEAIRSVNPHVDFVNLDDHGYSIIEIDPDQLRMQWYAISDRRDPHGRSRLLASRTVRSGAAELLTD